MSLKVPFANRKVLRETISAHCLKSHRWKQDRIDASDKRRQGFVNQKEKFEQLYILRSLVNGRKIGEN